MSLKNPRDCSLTDTWYNHLEYDVWKFNYVLFVELLNNFCPSCGDKCDGAHGRLCKYHRFQSLYLGYIKINPLHQIKARLSDPRVSEEEEEFVKQYIKHEQDHNFIKHGGNICHPVPHPPQIELYGDEPVWLPYDKYLKHNKYTF